MYINYKGISYYNQSWAYCHPKRVSIIEYSRGSRVYKLQQEEEGKGEPLPRMEGR